MKRFKALFAVLMTLTVLLTLAACGGQDQKTPSDPKTPDSSQTEQNDGNMTNAVDLNALREKMIADSSLTDVLPVETAALENIYGIQADQVKNSASFNASSGAAFPQEIVMIEAVDETAAADIAQKLEGRLATIAEQAASYEPDSKALAEKCKVVTKGVYVGLFFSSHYDAMVSAFQAAV